MKKKWMTLITAACVICSACGCGNREPEGSGISVTPIIVEDITGQEMGFPNTDTADSDINQDGTHSDDTVQDGADSSEADQDAAHSNEASGSESGLHFSDLQYLEFWFASGAGAWATQLSIRPDGSFSGEYHDSDMGDRCDDYPNGTRYQCTFSGSFSQPVKINDYTYSMQILSISYVNEPDTSEIKDDTLYHYTTPYGLDETDSLLVYLPGAPLAELPEGYRSWVGYYYLENTTDTTLPYYGLYNEAEAEGFSSYALADSLKNHLAFIEELAAEIEDSMEHDATLSQADLNVKSAELYELWDSLLNVIWQDLKRATDDETMRALTDEQLAWISQKEQEVDAAGAEYEGGSLQPLARNRKAAELTKARVYELLALMEEP